MLAVQDYLRAPGHTLETLTADYAIKVRVDEYLRVAALNYNQIESDMKQPICQECRGLILALGTWDVLCLPFKKFSNLGESYLQEFDWTNFCAYEKLDGTLISIYYHPQHGWQIATRGVPDASGPIDGSGMTFRTLTLLALKEMGYDGPLGWERFFAQLKPRFTYHFELTAPENRIVVAYSERKLSLLAVRDSLSLKELALSGFPHLNPAKLYEFSSKEQLLEAATLINPIEHEGFVVKDWADRRLKIKSEAWCLASKCRDSLGASRLNQFEMILSEKQDDVKSLLPEFVVKSMELLETDMMLLLQAAKNSWLRYRFVDNQRDFALYIKHLPFAHLLFEQRRAPKPDFNTEIFLDMARRNPRKALEMIDNTTKLLFAQTQVA
jgi:hypothetical protein